MRNLSWLLFLAVVVLVAVGVVQIRQNDDLTGTELFGWALLSLALLLGFTCPTRCKVETSKHTACRNEAYGFLFGCRRYGHWGEKFLIRMRLRHGETKPIQAHEAAAAHAFTYQPAEKSEPMKVILEDNARSKFLFWVAVISMVAGIVQVVVAIH